MKRILDGHFALRHLDRARWIVVLFAAALGGTCRRASPPQPRSRTADAGDQPRTAEAVKSALQREIYGQGRERAELLAAAVQQSPYARPFGTWGKYATSKDAGRRPEKFMPARDFPPRLRSLSTAAHQLADNIEGNLALAQWCTGRELREQARTQLMRVVDLAGSCPRPQPARLYPPRWRMDRPR